MGSMCHPPIVIVSLSFSFLYASTYVADLAMLLSFRLYRGF
uniref:Uncharacterized protein n=1 Tax=Arundo donax TaxID=35708 RepID=A0A0A9HLZ1_ARUDO